MNKSVCVGIASFSGRLATLKVASKVSLEYLTACGTNELVAMCESAIALESSMFRRVPLLSYYHEASK